MSYYVLMGYFKSPLYPTKQQPPAQTIKTMEEH